MEWLWKTSHLETYNKELNYLDAVTGSDIGRSLAFAKKDEQPSDCNFFPGVAQGGQLWTQAGLLWIKHTAQKVINGKYKKRG